MFLPPTSAHSDARYYPTEVLESIAAAVFAAALPQPNSSLDPLYVSSSLSSSLAPTASPSTLPVAHWSELESRQALASLCLVSRTFRAAARPWLWRRLEVNVPRNWLGILDAVCGGDEEADVVPQQSIDTVLQTSDDSTGSSSRSRSATEIKDINHSLQALLFQSASTEGASSSTSAPVSLDGLGTVPHDLLTPPSSRDPSPARLRLRAASPGRWRFMKAVNKVVNASEPGLYVPTPDYPSPGRHVRHLDFNHFRTIGLRRLVSDGINARFVTAERLERLLKEMPNLTAFGATEFMDSAISPAVLSELILRGHPVQPEQRRPARRGRGSHARGDSASGSSDSESDAEGSDADEAERRAAAQPLEALDFCGCVSTVFVGALQAFVAAQGLAIPASNSPPSSSFSSPFATGSPALLPSTRKFTGLKRLGLRGVTSVPASTLAALVLSFPNLTHLDLTGTLCTPALLEALQLSATGADVTQPGSGMRLKSLGLGRCMRLTSESIARFIIGPAYESASDNAMTGGGICDELEELSLYGDMQYLSPLLEDDMVRIISTAPCFVGPNARMRYLDLSSCPVTERVLKCAFVSSTSSSSPASSLRSLGLSHIPSLPLEPLVSFLTSRAPNVEILTLVGSSLAELSMAGFGGSGRVGEVALALTVRSKLIDPLAGVPFRFRISAPAEGEEEEQPKTRLRVLELSPALLNLLPPAPVGSLTGPAWTTVRSRGGRAWYVDAGACWVNGRFVRSTASTSTNLELKGVRDAIGKLASSAGTSGGQGCVGWHAHKMEILHGLGMFGREDGLYGAVSFAYTTG